MSTSLQINKRSGEEAAKTADFRSSYFYSVATSWPPQIAINSSTDIVWNSPDP
jgi:hypothetical protein